jgi:hypothetical protein
MLKEFFATTPTGVVWNTHPFETNIQRAVEQLLKQVQSDIRSLESDVSSTRKQLKDALERVETLER